ncbi:hypothetical protein VM99_25840 [Pseudomonas chlororaphis]|uniref:Uncharacterized protein n=1 Tax=Pseudomonas chlororaphis TaxID=587753 RepID=A0A0G3GJL3_9PSED|nr:hypothetical protein VM99_25840 [Pseudomonas chlororaphis]
MRRLYAKLFLANRGQIYFSILCHAESFQGYRKRICQECGENRKRGQIYFSFLCYAESFQGYRKRICQEWDVLFYQIIRITWYSAAITGR